MANLRAESLVKVKDSMLPIMDSESGALLPGFKVHWGGYKMGFVVRCLKYVSLQLFNFDMTNRVMIWRCLNPHVDSPTSH